MNTQSPNPNQPPRLLQVFLRAHIKLIAMAFPTYFLLGSLHAASFEWVGCEGERATVYFWLLLAYVCGAVLLLCGAPLMRLRRAVPAAEASARSAVRAFGQGVLRTLLFFSVVLVFGALDRGSADFAPGAHHDTWSPMMNRALDFRSAAICAVSPSHHCRVLVTAKGVPFRSTIALRACKSGNDLAYSACQIPLHEGRLPRYTFCRRDAQKPINMSMCSTGERKMHRRALGLIVHGESS